MGEYSSVFPLTQTRKQTLHHRDKRISPLERHLLQRITQIQRSTEASEVLKKTTKCPKTKGQKVLMTVMFVMKNYTDMYIIPGIISYENVTKLTTRYLGEKSF